MSHKNGIKAAAQKYYEFCHGTDYAPELDVAKIIKAYLDSSGTIIVPRKPTDDMMFEMECAATGLASFAFREESPSYKAYLAAVNSFSDVFKNTDEVSKNCSEISEWQPIETAPVTSHSDKILLAWRHRPVSTGWWDVDEDYRHRPHGWVSPEEGWRADGDACIPVSSGWPTHWMTLPEPPKP